jgi:glyoxylase-like metal-dependent hydrolase (beta-lactamase superfamily II)
LKDSGGPDFLDRSTQHSRIAEELDGEIIDLEGEEMVSIPTGHTDTHCTTCLHVPSIGLVAAGDVAYNDVHIYLAESNTDSRKQ